MESKVSKQKRCEGFAKLNKKDSGCSPANEAKLSPDASVNRDLANLSKLG